MSETKSTAPETLEELRAALRRWVDGTRSYADHVERDAGAYQDAVWRIAIHRDAANQIAALLPEPIKVGDRVRAEHDPSFEGDVLGGPWDDNGDQTCAVRMDNGEGIDLWCVADLTRVTDEQPEPEPEHEEDDDERPVCRSCDGERTSHLTDAVACPRCGGTGEEPAPAPSPSPEVGEGWRRPVDMAEADAAWGAGVLGFWTGFEWTSEHLARPGSWWPPSARTLLFYRLPSGWAEGRELVDAAKAAPHGGRTIDGIRVKGLNRFGDVILADEQGTAPAVDGKVWVDPLPKQETETVEPHESEDPEELAAAVAAGLTVDFWGVLSKRWMRSGVELSAEGYRRRIGKGERFQIHGTVPGWAEGRELVPVVRALGRTIGGDPVVKWAANRLGDPSAYVMLNHESYGRRVPADPDGKVWVDPLPRQETETVEPHESEDPEELAAAVAAGLTVNPRPPGADWRDRQTYDRRVGTFREALDYGFRYRIWGTVPGYGETDGAS